MTQPLPKCPMHKEEMERVTARQLSEEANWCGVWYRCTKCTSSALVRSPGLEAQLAEQRKRLSQRQQGNLFA